MGEIIRKDAAVEDILSDVRTTHTRAAMRGGIWKDLSEARLGPVLAVIAAMENKYRAAEEKQTPALAKRDAVADSAEKLIGRVADDFFNELGRPASDPFLSLLFPGGIQWYTKGDTDGLPARMGLLVGLLRTIKHPQLAEATMTAAADEIDAAIQALKPAVDEASLAWLEADMLGRVRAILARSAQLELAALKRLYKGHGLREAEIHEVIPSRARSTATKQEQSEPTQ